MPIDVVNAVSSSAQTEAQQSSTFSEYTSPFFSYPLLRSRSRVVSDLALAANPSFSHLSQSEASRSSFDTIAAGALLNRMIPNLRPLRAAVMSRETGKDSVRRICQYEVPGGGACRDKTCSDIHLNDFEPDDHEIARYLLETMPNTLQAYDESEIIDQLLQARQRRSALSKTSVQPGFPSSLEDTIADAIAALTAEG